MTRVYVFFGLLMAALVLTLVLWVLAPGTQHIYQQGPILHTP